MLMQSTNQTLIADYLMAVRDATRSLPTGKRETIIGDLEAHIEQALSIDAGEAEIRTLLDRLGSPEAIAAEAGANDAPITSKKGPSRVREIFGLIGLSAGSLFIPIIGWIVGVVLIWQSPVWSKLQKITAALVWPGGWFAMLYLPLVSLRSSISVDTAVLNPGVRVLLVILFIAAPLVVLAWLIRTLVRADSN
ncbi:MAG: hypothetical protein OEY55_04285 [Acidimicrobiia bacterium]|nr:hypothetical protein [Acidimicrobiia bacterium]